MLVPRTTGNYWGTWVGLAAGIPLGIALLVFLFCCMPCLTGDKTWPPHNQLYPAPDNNAPATTGDSKARVDAANNDSANAATSTRQ